MSKLFHIISYYLHYGNKHLLYSLNILYVLFSNVNTILVSGVISDDELHTGHHNNPMEHEDVPDGARTPSTPPARSPPPPSPPQSRIPAVAHLRPVSIPCHPSHPLGRRENSLDSFVHRRRLGRSAGG